jgi:hypothetical protein
MNHHVRSTLVLSFFLIPILSFLIPRDSPAQQTGEQAEMDRLEQQADDLAAQTDPEGAALAIGKAAMMADFLSQNAQDSHAAQEFESTAFLFRAQEHGLRALALFEQAGGTPPASGGICHYLIQGHKKLHRSKELLMHIPAMRQMEMPDRRERRLEKIVEWKTLLRILHEDFECS